jgi:2-polyprenyl-3-methyl-5-hydroxy-6-metoxy-1,4-benzoquinol methylase
MYLVLTLRNLSAFPRYWKKGKRDAKMDRKYLVTPCPACQTPFLKPWFTISNQYGNYPIVCCSGCRSGFILPRPTAEEIEAFYKTANYEHHGKGSPQARFDFMMDQEKSYPNSTLDAARISAACRRWSLGDRFLDIGAGHGFFTKAAIERGFRVTALEPSPSSRDVFKLMNSFDPLPELLNEKFVAAHVGEFDVVLMRQVLEHVRDLDWTVSALHSLLADGGIAAIAVPHFRSFVSILQGRNDMFIVPPEHLNFFTAKGLKQLFQRHGFSTLAFQTISRVDGKRIARKLRLGFLGGAFPYILKAPLFLVDLAKMGLYLNVYFRKRDYIK